MFRCCGFWVECCYVKGNHLECAEENGVVTEIDGTWVVKPNGHDKLTLVAPKCDAADSVWFRMSKVATGADGASEDVSFPKSGYMVHNSGNDPKTFKHLTSQQKDRNRWMLSILECWGRQARSRWSAAGSGPDTR